MQWTEEVATAEAEVRAELSEVERALAEDVPVVAVDTRGSDYRWGAYFPADRRVEIYRPAFDEMPDPENRDRQVREVIRHELRHVFGEQHPEAGHETSVTRTGNWYGRGPVTVVSDGFVVHIPELPPR